MNFQKAERRDVPLIIGIAGPSGGGKTYSALRLARGLAGGGPIAAIDTERGRMLHYADEFDFLHAELDAPFSPARYGEAIDAALAIEPAIVLIDSFSHEWAGDGGVIDMQEAELERMAGGDWKKREAVRFASWIKPKGEHKELVNDRITRMPCHLILCLRAEDRVEMKKDPKTGKLEVVPKRTLAGHEGWIPVTGKEVAYELTVSVVVTPDKPGVPQPVKIQAQHRGLIPLDAPLDENVGEALAAWAKGSAGGPSGNPPAPSGESDGPPAEDPGALSSSPPAPQADPALTASQAKKLDVLVGTLRDQRELITTEQLYGRMASLRNVDVDVMIGVIEGARDEEGVLHWSPLRQSLTKDEASVLIEKLANFEKNAPVAA